MMDIVTGVLKGELTNLDSGKSIDVNISSSGETHYYPDGSGKFDLTGPTLFWYFPDPNLPAMFTNSGQIRFQWDPEGNLTSYSITGHLVDICQALSN